MVRGLPAPRSPLLVSECGLPDCELLGPPVCVSPTRATPYHSRGSLLPLTHFVGKLEGSE